MDVFYTYTYSTAGWLSLQALPLLLSPKLIVTLLSAESRNPTDLETYFSRSLAIALITLALLAILLTGSVPLSPLSSNPAASSSSSNDPTAPYVHPTLLLTTTFHSTCATYGYIQYLKTGQTAFTLGVAGYGSLAAMGLWCVLFGQGGHVSRRTGADKRTSGWPFGNVEAGRKKGGKGI